MRLFNRVLSIAAATLLCSPAWSAAALLKDINGGAYPGYAGAGNFVSLNGLTFFLATDAEHGQELWRTDGTPAGTKIVRDIVPGVNSSGITRMTGLNGVLYFYANDAVNGEELWRSDGTQAGTQVVADINRGAGDSLPPGADGAIGSLGGVLYFPANDASSTGLWRSDGTATGTYRITNAKLSSGEVVIAGQRIFFVAPGSDGSGATVWSTDGTAAGTKQVSDDFPALPGATASLLTPTTSGLFFVASDGSDKVRLCFVNFDGSSLHVVKDLTDTNHPINAAQVSSMVALGADVVFNIAGKGIFHADASSADLIHAQNFVPDFQVMGGRALFTISAIGTPWSELWTTDGTSAGTHRLGASAQLMTQQQIAHTTPLVIGEDGAAYFGGLLVTTAPYTYAIWRTDGTDAGTAAYATLASGVMPGYFLVRFASEVYYECNCGATGSQQLWRSDGTSHGTELFFDPGADAVGDLASAGESLFFTRDVGRTLMVSDGTPAGTHALYTFSTDNQGLDSNANGFTQLGDSVIFVADDGTHGYELYSSDIGSRTTQRILDLNPGAGNGLGNQPLSLGSRALLAGNDGHGLQLWVTDGTAAGTVVLAAAAPELSPSNVAVVSGVAYFAADDGVHGSQPWRSDGTVAGTRMIADTGASTFASNFRPLNGTIVFWGQSANQWWVTDGTAAGTHVIAPGVTGNGQPAILNGLLYFGGLTNGGSNGDLWVTDGTAGGTHVALTLSNESISAVHGLTNRIVLETVSLDPSLHLRPALFGTDGSGAGTGLIAPDPVGASLSLGTQFIYTVPSTDGSSGLVRTTDGTATGTRDVITVPNPGPLMYAYKGTALFTSATLNPANSQSIPSIWRTDGTVAGTHQVATGIRGSSFAAIGSSLYFLGWTTKTGAEPFVVDELSPNTASDGVSTPAETAVTVDVLANDGFLSAKLRPESVSISASAQGGSTTVDSSGKVIYTPMKGFSGSDTFSYVVTDVMNQTSAPTTVTVVVGAEPGPAPGSAPTDTGGGTDPGSGNGGSGGSGGSGGGAAGGSPSGPTVSKGGGGQVSLGELLVLAALLSVSRMRRARRETL